MSYTDFDLLFSSAPTMYALALVISFATYFVIIRKRIHSVFDPLFINLVFAVFGAATVLFLFFTSAIKTYYFIQFCTTEFLYLICLIAVPEPRADIRLNNAPLTTPSNRRFLQGLYLSSVAVFVFSQLVTYAIAGIPLFSDNSRLQYYTGGSGFGLLSRLLDISSFFCWYLIIYRFVYQWKIKFWPALCDVLVLLLLIAAAVLSGSRSTFINVVFIIFYFRLIHCRTPEYSLQRDAVLARLQRRILVAALVCALLVLMASGRANGIGTAVFAFCYRLMSSGDAYFMAYPHGTLSNLDSGNPFLAMFGGALEAVRLVRPTSLPEPLGFQLMYQVTGLRILFGPNPRHNVFGLVYFGFAGSMIYSALLGLSVGFVRNVGYRYVRVGGFSELIFVLCAISIVSINTDVNAIIGPVSNLILVSPLLLMLAFALSYSGRTDYHKCDKMVAQSR